MNDLKIYMGLFSDTNKTFHEVLHSSVW
jgi:hypothetical protein